MTTTLISTQGQYTFGQMSNRMIASLISANTNMARISEAIATASSGYTGVEGTQFELASGGNVMAPAAMAPGQNLFGVVPSSTAGEQGAAYRYAMEQLAAAWGTFWAAAETYVKQLDNGQQGMG